MTEKTGDVELKIITEEEEVARRRKEEEIEKIKKEALSSAIIEEHVILMKEQSLFYKEATALLHGPIASLCNSFAPRQRKFGTGDPVADKELEVMIDYRILKVMVDIGMLHPAALDDFCKKNGLNFNSPNQQREELDVGSQVLSDFNGGLPLPPQRQQQQQVQRQNPQQYGGVQPLGPG